MAAAASPDTTAQPRPFQVVVAATPSWGIGAANALPWRLPGDMAFFKTLTTRTADPAKRNAVLMGRSTWESLPAKFRPLPGRLNIVISASGKAQAAQTLGEQDTNREGSQVLPPGVLVAPSLEAGLALAPTTDIETAFVIGGGQLYSAALASPSCEAVHLTQVELAQAPQCDTHMPALDASSWALYCASSPQRVDDSQQHPGGGRFTFLHYLRAGAKHMPASWPPGVEARHEEWQYLDLIRHIITSGAARGDRTGTGTLSVFGRQMRFDLRRSFPLLTTKRVFWRGVAEELLWFVSGCTDARVLRDKDIHIWDGNGSREFLDANGLGHREEWDLGPVYGFQWRHFGAEYTDMHADYAGKGVDQLAQVVHLLRTRPHDRRIILSAWNPAALSEMALPPCHMMAQFYVADGELSCQMYQRSCDMGLGVPFNIASYALLTRMLAHVTGLAPGELVHTLGDAHVYMNHVEALNEQLERTPRAFPTMRIARPVADIDGFKFEDFVIDGYNPHPKIDMVMAV